MDAKHKQLKTTNPVAIKHGQGRVHVPGSPIPWHAFTEAFKCPECETVFVLAADRVGGFPTAKLLEVVKEQHKKKLEHPDYITFDPVTVADCDCNKAT
jgi:hypothetical protein